MYCVCKVAVEIVYTKITLSTEKNYDILKTNDFSLSHHDI